VTALRVIGLAYAASLCLLGLEWRYLGGLVAAPADTPIRLVPAPLTHPVLPSPAAADLHDLVRTILERPLFSQTRRPATAADGFIVRKDPALPRLSGILLLPKLRRAIFEAPGAAGPVATIVGETGKIDNWTVKSIDRDGVALTRNDDTMFLTPAFANVEAVRASPPAPPLSRWEAPADQGILRARWSNPHLQP
jgi:hypothetical protein